MELAKSYSKALIFQQGSANIDLTYQLLFEFNDLAKFVNIGLHLMMENTMTTIVSIHNINFVLGCIAFSLLIVDSIEAR